MIEINLIPEEERKKIKKVRFKRPTIAIPGLDMILSILLLLAAVGTLFFMNKGTTTKIIDFEDKIESSRKELKQLEKEKQIVENLQNRQKELSRWVSLVQDLNKGRSLTTHVMEEINRLKPDYMWLVSFEENEGNFKIEGKTFSNLIISSFMVHLRESQYFSDIRLQEVSEKKEKDQRVMGFTVSGRIVSGSGG
ncbi:PilN domain-containing protein [candidate division WOR-3 bacterium]|nr:PilN domain-containing protein [candidate division WOR-3 bacterium]